MKTEVPHRCLIISIFFLFLCGFGWKLCRTATMQMQSALCHCPLLSEWGWSSDNQSSQHALVWSNWPMQTLSGIYHSGPVKLKDKMGEVCINGKLSVQEPSEWRVFAYLWVIWLYFSRESTTKLPNRNSIMFIHVNAFEIVICHIFFLGISLHQTLHDFSISVKMLMCIYILLQ